MTYTGKTTCDICLTFCFSRTSYVQTDGKQSCVNDSHRCVKCSLLITRVCIQK